MRKKLKWLAGGLKMLSFLILASVVFISCADDNDGTTDDQDSANVNTTNSTAAGEDAAVRKYNRRPDTVSVNGATRLAVLQSEASQYRFGVQLIVTLQNSDTSREALQSNGYGRWYAIDSLPDPFNPRNRERLTNNVYGYLSYHDMVVRHPREPHTLFLKWYRNGNKIDSVVAWIKPAPVITTDTTATLFELSDPPRPRVPPPPAME